MKKLISALLTAAMLFGVFAAAPFTVNAAKDVPVSGEVITEADSSVGAILGEAVGRNEQEDHQSESIADVTIDGRTAAVTLMHTKKCMVAVGVYDENDNTLLRTAIQRDISEDCEYIEIGFDNDLPDFYYLRAFILDENCAPIGKQFETNRYTLAYKEFLEKSTEDFPQEKVINFDGDDNNNFAVFDSAVREIDTDGGNRPTKTENSFVFSGADESLLGLREDDIIYFDCGGETELVKVGTVHVSGGTVTITPAEAKMEEFFDYVKIDVTAEEAAADMSEADEGVELVERDENSVGALDTECNFNRSFSFDLTKAMKQGGIEISGAKAELEMKSKMHFRLYYGGDVLETELTDEIEGELDVELGVTAKFSIGLPKLVFPTPVAGLTIAVKPAFEAEISAAFHGKVKIDTRAGFRYNSQSGFANLSQNPKLDAEVNFEGKIYVGFKLTPSIQAAFGVVELGVDIKVGAEGVGKRVITTTDFREFGHTCRWCIDGAINGKVSIEAELSTGLWKKLSYTVSAKLIDWEKKLYDFYYSSDLGFGKGGCPKLDPKTKPQDDPPVYQRMKLDYEEGAYTVNYVVSGDRKHVTAYVTGSGNVSSYNCFGVQKFMDDYNQKTHEKAEEVYPYDWEKQWEYYYDHCILLADSSFGVSIYISGFNAINADTRDYLCPDVHISGSTKVVNISYCKSIQLPDSVEELYIKTIKDFSSFRFPPRLKYIGGFGWCEDLTELTIPSSLEYVDGFLYCPITKLTIMPREKPLVLRDFDHCPIYDLVIPQGVSLLYFHPIDSTLKNITVQTDTKALLRFCKEIEEVHFISPLPSVGDECCNNCKNLKRVSFEPSVKYIGRMAFSYSGLERVTIPGTVKKIGDGAFQGCENLREIIIEDGVKEIAPHAFDECPNLERVVLPASLTYLSADVFANSAKGIELCYCGEPWQWWNITTDYRNIDGHDVPLKMLDLEYDASIFMNCVIHLNSDGTSRRTASQQDSETVGAASGGLFADTEYLIAVEGSENGQLGGAVTALMQVKSDENGNLEIPENIHVSDGEFLNLYGVCRHPSGHLEENQLICDVCGEKMPAVIDDGEEQPQIGDANSDGKVTIDDATMIQKFVAELVELTPDQFIAADTNCDGIVNIDDATMIQKYIAELIDHLG